MNNLTGWLRLNQLRIITALQSTVAVLILFGIVDWTEPQIGGVIAAVTAWLGLAATQNVDTRALEELDRTS